MKKKFTTNTKFNIFNFISTFARSLVEIFVSLYLFKNGFSIHQLLLFFILENLFSIFLAYVYAIIGEKYNYSIPMFIGIISFAGLQLLLFHYVNSLTYIILISLLYASYRKGYWISRRFYITNIMPKKESSGPFSIVMVVGQLGSIIAGYIGSLLLDGLNMNYLIILSSILFIISVIPLITIKYEKTSKKIELIKNLKKYDKRNFLAFSIYELNNLLEFIFPIYIAIYIKDTYTMAGTTNAISKISIIIFILIYGKLIKKKNYFVLSTIIVIVMNILKLFTLSYTILVAYFLEGIVKKMQNQSLNKIYFENQNEINNTHHSLIYQIIESVVRVIVTLPLLFVNDLSVMIIFVIGVITLELIIYTCIKKDQILT